MSGYQIKITMENTKPPVWRRLEIPDQITFRDLHNMLQEAFGWEDMHLHDFTFQNTRVSVGSPEESEYDEQGLLADDFLRAGWIRYTYDYGDDWRHKIVLEKELPDQEARCARVVKFKGDNFEEDSGGVWGDSDAEGSSRIPYDMETVNERLAGFICQKHPEASTAEEQGIWVTQKKEKREKTKQILGMMSDFGQVLREALQIEPAPIDLLAEKMADAWDDLEEGDCWEIRDSSGEILDILAADGYKHLFEMVKYLAVPRDAKMPFLKSMAEHIEKALKEHPEYLVLAFDQSELRLYVDCYRRKDTAQLPERHILMGLAMWGLAELELVQKKNKPYLHIGLPKDAENIVSFFETQDLEDLRRRSERVWERVYGMLLCYGFMEINDLHEQYNRIFGEIPREELERCLYLCGSFRKVIVTGSSLNDGEEEMWAALSVDIAKFVTETMSAEMTVESAAEPTDKENRIHRNLLTYKEFTRKQILEMKRLGYSSLYPQWTILLRTLRNLDFEEWEAVRFLNDWYDQVQNGEGMISLLEDLESDKELFLPEDWTVLEHALCRCWAETGIPYLKGHSRLEIAAETGQNLFEVAAEDGYELAGYVERNLNRVQKPDVSGQAEPKVDPDAFCPCGSGKRYRQCCGRKKR